MVCTSSLLTVLLVCLSNPVSFRDLHCLTSTLTEERAANRQSLKLPPDAKGHVCLKAVPSKACLKLLVFHTEMQ